jgi:hypothetical protein
VPVPDISFRKSDLTELFGEIPFREESLTTNTQYGIEYVFYLDKHGTPGSSEESGLDPEAGLADFDWRSASTDDVLAYRDRIVDASTEHFAQGRTQAGVQSLRLLAKATIDDNTLLRTDGFLPSIAAGRKIVATFDVNRQPAPDEVVLIYGNYPHMFGNVVVNNPIKRHVADFWGFRHDIVEYDYRWDGIGRIFIVNVDARRDRYDGVLRELASARAPFHLITRVSARPISPEALGSSGGQAACLRSHIDTLRQAQATGCHHVLVLEDDFCFSSDLELHLSDLRTFVERDYDYWVCLVATSKYGPLVPKDDLVAMSFQKCTNTGGYLISRPGLEKVLEVFEAALARMTASGDHVANAVDRCWAVLQPTEKFLVFRRKLGFQVSSFSDIERSISRYLD